MRNLTRATIDNIFEPRRSTNLGVRTAAYRLLVDTGGRFQYIDRHGALHRLQPTSKFPVWVPVDALPVEPLLECLPGPGSQAEAMEALYRIAFPQWDSITHVEGWPKVSYNTAAYIIGRFQEFDRRMAPGCVPGGAWMNQGFSTLNSESIPDWRIDVSGCTVTYQEAACA